MAALIHLTTELRSHVLVVRITSEKLIEPKDVHEFDAELARVVQEQTQRAMMIDFARVNRIATGVINSLLLTKKKMLASGGDMVLFGMRQNIRHTCRLLRLDGTIFQIFEEEDQAIGHFQVDT